jgi:phosphatidylinositol alpha-1,6-mannosyltransferase
MKVFCLLTDAFGGFGGISVYNVDLLRALCAQPDIELVTAIPRVMPRPEDQGVLPQKLKFESAAAAGNLSYIRSLAQNVQQAATCDVIYCAHVNLLPIAYVLAKVFRKPLVLAIYGIDAWQPTGRALVDKLVTRADLIISISDYTTNRFVAWSGADRSRIRLVPNAIHLDQYSPGVPDEGFVQTYGLKGKKVMVTFGRLVSQERAKGFDEVLDVLSDIRKIHPDVMYMIAGTGPYRAELEEKVRRLDLAQSVVFTGYVSEEQKVDLFRCADVFVMPSRGEGFGFVLLEALACGIPTIASKFDGGREAVRDGQMGAIVDPDNREELIREILSAFTKPKKAPPELDYFSFANFSERAAAAFRSVATSVS